MEADLAKTDRTALVDRLADDVLAALDARRQIVPLSDRYSGFDLDAANEVNARVCFRRRARGERPIGRKLGFTNRNIWEEYKVYAPIWSYMYDTTVRDAGPDPVRFEVASVIEPRLEPEITLGLARAPEPGMDEVALLECIDFVAHGFEIVQSLFPGWKFAAADTVAGFGLHGALLLGPRLAVTDANRVVWLERLRTFEVRLSLDGSEIDRGIATNVLGGPLTALKNVVSVLAGDPYNPPIAAGEIVTTGTITRAFPMKPGQIWKSSFVGAPFAGLTLFVV